jgi:hypothetical protein
LDIGLESIAFQSVFDVYDYEEKFGLLQVGEFLRADAADGRIQYRIVAAQLPRH